MFSDVHPFQSQELRLGITGPRNSSLASTAPISPGAVLCCWGTQLCVPADRGDPLPPVLVGVPTLILLATRVLTSGEGLLPSSQGLLEGPTPLRLLLARWVGSSVSFPLVGLSQAKADLVASVTTVMDEDKAGSVVMLPRECP